MALSSPELDALRGPLEEGLRRLSGPWNASAASIASAAEDALVEKLLSYTAELYRFNDKLRLVDAEPEEFVTAHLLDSLAPISELPPATVELFEKGCSLLDLGSGAGLPGIPLALAFPHVSVTLLDRSGRRCGFLRNAKAILGRRDISIVQGDLKEGTRRHAGAFDLVTARAFHPLEPKLFGELRSLLTPEGEILLYKGRRDQAEAELARILEALESRGEPLPESVIREVDVPGLQRERTLLLLKMCA